MSIILQSLVFKDGIDNSFVKDKAKFKCIKKEWASGKTNFKNRLKKKILLKQ